MEFLFDVTLTCRWVECVHEEVAVSFFSIEMMC
jgi:hypothetical protein